MHHVQVVNAFDHIGKVARALGASATYVIDQHGGVAYQHAGGLAESIWNATLLPIIQALRDTDS